MTCDSDHRYSKAFEELPGTQGGPGRHRCAACAYLLGLEHGRQRKEQIDLTMEFGQLNDSQAGTVRHKSPHAAYAVGYLHGVQESYGQAVTRLVG